MSTLSQSHALSARATAGRLPTRGFDSRPHRRIAEGSDLAPAMGPANRAPGISIAGLPSRDGYPRLMGGPDQGSLLSIMGGGDRGGRIELFGRSELEFVDSLFSRPRDER